MATYGYARVSTQAQTDEGVSLAVQQRQLEGWAMMMGRSLDRVFVEGGVSGSVSPQERPAGEQLWTGLKRGDAIVAVKLDRVFRSALDALQCVGDLRDMGVSLFLLDIGGDVTGNGISKLFLTIMSAVAEAERDRIRERIATAKRDQKAQHRFLGGLMPFGFVKQGDGTLIADPAMQEHIAVARRLRSDGKSLRTIRDVLASSGCRVSVDALHRTLRVPEGE